MFAVETAVSPRTGPWVLRPASRVLAALSAHPELLQVCSCCGALPTCAVSLRGSRSGPAYRVPYCDDCLSHQARDRTQVLSLALASVVLAVGSVTTLPLVLPAVWALAACFLLASAPWWVAFRAKRVLAGHAAMGPAACVNREGELYLWRHELAQAVAQAAGAELARASQPRPRHAWALAGVLVVACAFPFVHVLYYPLVRVVNLTDDALVVSVDGAREIRVEPTSGEARGAGAWLRVRLGARSLEARGVDGVVADRVVARVQGGRRHLYAPGRHGQCFWIEVTPYGRARVESSRIELDEDSNFWVLPLAIDSWFGPNPPSGDDNRSTGGALTALRHGPCRTP